VEPGNAALNAEVLVVVDGQLLAGKLLQAVRVLGLLFGGGGGSASNRHTKGQTDVVMNQPTVSGRQAGTGAEAWMGRALQGSHLKAHRVDGPMVLRVTSRWWEAQAMVRGGLPGRARHRTP
jgi:hypothetical protein